MSKEKQIEEMASALENHTCMSSFQAEITSRTLYILGYRRKSEVAREIFEEIEKEIKKSLAEHNNKKMQYNIDDALFHLYRGIIASQVGMLDFIAELKKKYTEVKNDN